MGKGMAEWDSGQWGSKASNRSVSVTEQQIDVNTGWKTFLLEIRWEVEDAF